MTDTNRHRHLSNFSNQNQNSCGTWASIIRNNLSENLSCKCVIGTFIGALNFSVGIAMIGGFQLLDFIITELKSHMTC